MSELAESSLALTFLHSNSLLTGKLQGILDFLPQKFYSILSNLHILQDKVAPLFKSEQGINKADQGRNLAF